MAAVPTGYVPRDRSDFAGCTHGDDRHGDRVSGGHRNSEKVARDSLAVLSRGLVIGMGGAIRTRRSDY
jgi:hypothetical protein